MKKTPIQIQAALKKETAEFKAMIRAFKRRFSNLDDALNAYKKLGGDDKKSFRHFWGDDKPEIKASTFVGNG